MTEPNWTVSDLAAALRQLHRGQRVWSYPVEGEEAEAAWLVEWLMVHRAAVVADERLTWTYSGRCPKCGFVIRAELPALPSKKVSSSERGSAA